MKGKFFKGFIASLILVTVVASLLVSGCTQSYYNIPAGYIGKILSPTGWDSRILEAGQINLGQLGAGGQGSSLVLLEATTITAKEEFRGVGESDVVTDQKMDDRVLTRDGIQLSIDVFIRLMLPDTDSERNNIFVQVTPTQTQTSRVQQITMQDVYNRFATMDVRSAIRAIFAGYENYQDVLANYDKINGQIASAVQKVFSDNHVPLIFQNAALSNAKPDQIVLDAMNQKVAAQAKADAMNIIAQAVAKDPNNLIALKWQYLQQIASTAAQNGNTVIVITDSNGDTVPAISIPSSNTYIPPVTTTTTTTGGK